MCNHDLSYTFVWWFPKFWHLVSPAAWNQWRDLVWEFYHMCHMTPTDSVHSVNIVNSLVLGGEITSISLCCVISNPMQNAKNSERGTHGSINEKYQWKDSERTDEPTSVIVNFFNVNFFSLSQTCENTISWSSYYFWVLQTTYGLQWSIFAL